MKSLVDIVNLLFGEKPEKDKAATWQLLNSVSNYLLYCERVRHEHNLKPQPALLPGLLNYSDP